MKENVLEVLMYLFQNYMDEEAEVQPDRESLQTELQEAGFQHGEIHKAFDWLDGLSEQTAGQPQVVPAGRSIRVYADEECDRLDMESRGFLMFLEQTGIVTPAIRELIIERVMALDSDDFDLEQLKWVVLMVLFNQPGEEEAYAWMEDLVFEEFPGYLH
jgi:Smg protein